MSPRSDLGRTVQVTIFAPTDWISANGRYHYHAKRRLVLAWREAARDAPWEARDEAGTVRLNEWGDCFGEERVRIEATVHKSNNRGRWDVLNLADTAKACVDGLVDAGMLVDDSNRYVVGPDMRAGEPWPSAALVLVLTPIEEEKKP